MKITAIILSKNEEKNIERALRSTSFCNEIIIVDDNSTDKTVEIARKFKANILSYKVGDDFAKARNWSMEKAQHEWILFLDSDEEVAEELKNRILKLVQDSKKAYYIKRRDFWWGRELKYGETLKLRNKGLIRLMKKGSGSWKGSVHEEFISNCATYEVGSLSGFINHYPHPSLREFIENINTYSTLRALELHNAKVKSSIFSIILYPLGKFILNYFIYLGFLDGPAGFTYAFLMSFHSFLVRGKLYQYSKID